MNDLKRTKDRKPESSDEYVWLHSRRHMEGEASARVVLPAVGFLLVLGLGAYGFMYSSVHAAEMRDANNQWHSAAARGPVSSGTDRASMSLAGAFAAGPTGGETARVEPVTVSEKNAPSTEVIAPIPSAVVTATPVAAPDAMHSVAPSKPAFIPRAETQRSVAPALKNKVIVHMEPDPVMSPRGAAAEPEIAANEPSPKADVVGPAAKAADVGASAKAADVGSAKADDVGASSAKADVAGPVKAATAEAADTNPYDEPAK